MIVNKKKNLSTAKFHTLSARKEMDIVFKFQITENHNCETTSGQNKKNAIHSFQKNKLFEIKKKKLNCLLFLGKKMQKNKGMKDEIFLLFLRFHLYGSIFVHSILMKHRSVETMDLQFLFSL